MWQHWTPTVIGISFLFPYEHSFDSSKLVRDVASIDKACPALPVCLFFPQVPNSILSRLVTPFGLGIPLSNRTDDNIIPIAIPILYHADDCTRKRVPVERVDELVSKIASRISADFGTDEAKTREASHSWNPSPETVQFEDLIEEEVVKYYSQLDTEAVSQPPGLYKKSGFDLNKKWAYQFLTDEHGLQYQPLVAEGSSWFDNWKRKGGSPSISRDHECHLKLSESSVADVVWASSPDVGQPLGDIRLSPQVQVCGKSDYPLWSLISQSDRDRLGEKAN